MKLQGILQIIDMGEGRTIEIESGILAKQAHGSVVLKCGKTMLLATVVSNYQAKPDLDFLPLTVDYQEKFAAVGRIPGSFLKREGRLSDYEVLICRIIDRALRPLFPEDYHCETQVAISLISSDENIMPDALVGLAASAAIMLSDIPFAGPVSEVRVGRIDGKFVVNPTKEEIATSDIDIIIAGTMHDINMVEGEMSEISEADMVEALKFGHEWIKKHCQAQLELVEKNGGRTVREYEGFEENPELLSKIREFAAPRIAEMAKMGVEKTKRSEIMTQIKEELYAMYEEDEETDMKKVKAYFKLVEWETIREVLLECIRHDKIIFNCAGMHITKWQNNFFITGFQG